MRGKNNLNNQKGFTLVEIAIVMVIIGLLMGGVLKGQEMIKNAKVKRIARQADEFRAAVMSYQDRYKMLPGDDDDADTNTGVTVTVGDGDGTIESSEAPHMFTHLAASNLISGSYDGTDATYPKNPFGGKTHIEYATINTKTTHWVYYTFIPNDVCRIIDISMDDGVYDAGSVRASAVYTTDANITLYIEF